jgi:hypothetical protein
LLFACEHLNPPQCGERSRPSSLRQEREPIRQPFIIGKKPITKVTFTQNEYFSNIHFVVWQFWGRAAEGVLD